MPAPPGSVGVPTGTFCPTQIPDHAVSQTRPYRTSSTERLIPPTLPLLPTVTVQRPLLLSLLKARSHATVKGPSEAEFRALKSALQTSSLKISRVCFHL